MLIACPLAADAFNFSHQSDSLEESLQVRLVAYDGIDELLGGGIGGLIPDQFQVKLFLHEL